MKTIHEFLLEVEKAAKERSLRVEIAFARIYATKVRVRINPSTFIELYYSQETGKTSLAPIKEGKRIYGADNKDGWHVHPFGKPGAHNPCEEMAVEEFVGKALQYL